ncbi:MAG: radical SAM family heme chaperone HemW [Bacteroidales bacterium]|nr:radical SAM family heme chaperone HemW [Bacteroidales bacterium]
MIYVHVPFCRSFCTYCDFYSEVAGRCRKAEDAAKQESLFEDFAEALASEVRFRSEEITDDVNTLYIGGGTPSVLPLSAFQTLLTTLRSVGHSGPFDEFTVEVNPEDIVDKGPAYVEGLLDLGVNRISMGVQSFDDSVLKFMNRRHDSATARRAYAVLEDAGVRNISIDLIFGLPQLTSDQWSETLKKALDISSRGILPQHISSYQLSVEPGSMLSRLVEKGSWSEASEDLCQEQYSALCSVLAAAGYHHYEISNFAQPGFEARHNSAYWHHVPYVGLGPGAHSFLPSVRKWNRPDLQSYLAAAQGGDFTSVQEGETLDADQLTLERIMLGLRTSNGLPESYLRANCDPSALSRALAAGHLVSIGPNLRIPESNFFISDSIIFALV